MRLLLWWQEGEDLFPTGPDGKQIFEDTDYLETWKGMEDVNKKGLTKSIGISNFSKKQIERLLQNCEIAPVTNQVRPKRFPPTANPLNN